MHDVDEHLPECPAVNLPADDLTGAYYYIDDEEGVFFVTCICDRLRRCADAAYAAGVQAAIAVVKDRQQNLLDCHKDDDCHAHAEQADIIADDIEYVLFKMVDPLSSTSVISPPNTNNGAD